MPPKNWPNAIFYTTKYQYSKSAPPLKELLENVKNENLEVIKPPTQPSNLVAIKKVEDKSHPAHGELGLFAAKRLPPDSFIVLYLGVVHGDADADKASNYDLNMDSELRVGVDGSKVGNEARFINDYRGVRDQGPNAVFRDCLLDPGNGKSERAVGVYVGPVGKSAKGSQGIKKGEEILVSYGKGFWSHRAAEDAV